MLKIWVFPKNPPKIAASSFCVYLFGLESLAANSEGFLFLFLSPVDFHGCKHITLLGIERPLLSESRRQCIYNESNYCQNFRGINLLERISHYLCERLFECQSLAKQVQKTDTFLNRLLFQLFPTSFRSSASVSRLVIYNLFRGFVFHYTSWGARMAAIFCIATPDISRFEVFT